MPLRFRIVLGASMALALTFGFAHHAFPNAPFSFERLHIFLFNLCTGGATILYFTEGRQAPSTKVQTFFAIAVLYALSAFIELYIATLLLSVPLLGIVESVRVKRFSFFPLNFFIPKVPVSERFHHASVLCLSLGIVVASLVILNNEYLHLLHYDKLTLDVFFLGYSFPVSLITMSVMFSFMSGKKAAGIAPQAQGGVAELVAFWGVNLGVIIFFVFIIFGLFIAEIVIATSLLVVVCLIFALFVRRAPQAQQKNILTSGMVFLVCTGLTGVLYLLRYLLPDQHQGLARDLLTLHAFMSLYGWNLSGLVVILRSGNFPIRFNDRLFISLHWVTVLALAPLGKTMAIFAVLAVPAYLLLLGIALLSGGSRQARHPFATP